MIFDWNPETVALATQLWLDGSSAAVIARKIGCSSRNAVIGKVYRLGLPKRHNVTPRTIMPKRPRAPRAGLRFGNGSTIRLSAEPIPEIDDATVEGVSFMANKGCLWTLGDRRDGDGLRIYCGREKHKGSWCPSHRAIVYKPRQEDAA